MASSKKLPTPEEEARILADLRRQRQKRESSYRERALKLFPHVCGSCGREFSGRRLKELTVHHKDHNHDNNPPDGSNWELLCLYCHDHEHEKHKMKGYEGRSSRDAEQPGPSIFKPFEGLDALLNTLDTESDESQ